MHDTPSPSDFVGTLAPALRQAASIARALEGRVANRPKDGETTPVKAALTIADSAAQEALLVPLLEHFPQVRLEAEEDTPSVARFSETSEHLVVIDPIDGTLHFYLEGSGPYAVMIGLAIEGQYRAGLVALPRERLYFGAVRGAGASSWGSDGRSEPVLLPASRGNRVLVSHDLPARVIKRLQDRGYEVAAACGGAIAVAPLIPGVCAGLRLVRGTSAGVSIRGRIGAMIAAEAGALVEGATGEFPRGIREPASALLVAPTREHVEALREALSAA